MADFFNNRRDGSDDYSDNRRDGSGNFEPRQNNNFDRRYTGGRGGDEYFDRQTGDNRGTRNTRVNDDRLNRQLPPITDPFAQPAAQQPVYQPVQQYPQGAVPPSVVQGMMAGAATVNNVSLFTPKNFADVQVLIDHLRNHEPEIVELKGIDGETGQRMLDFLSGAIYALGGSMQQISDQETIFLLTPTGVSISSASDITRAIEERRKKR